jgi:hypothetical protein
MENQELHAQKVTILSRLIKESSLTLEEALLLLKEEDAIEEDVVQEPRQYVPQTGTSTWRTSPSTNPYTVTYPTFLSGISSSGTVPLTGSNVTFTNTIADSSADLNN